MQRRLKLIACLLLFTCLPLLSANMQRASAATFNQNNIIDDAVFNNTGALSASQIDSWLNTNFGSTSCISTSRGFSAPDPIGYNPTQGFLYGGNVSAGQVIYDAAQAYGINPQVLLATLQKEQSLVAGDSGCSVLRYAAATGYGCPDGGTSYSYSGVNLYTINGTTVTSVSGTCVNSSSKVGFTQQLIRSAWLLEFGEHRSEGNINWAIIKTNWDNSDDPQTCYSGPMTQGTWERCPSGGSSFYDGYTTIDATSVHIDDGATAALYWYTPHFSGNQNFQSIFNGWFGTTYAFIYNGVHYSVVFDPVYYVNSNSDLKAAFGDDQIAAFNHFLNYGMSEGRQASPNFDVTSYRNRYSDLRWKFSNDLPAYYIHYITNGQYEGRVATGAATLQPVTSYNGIDYSNVYDFNTYASENSDIGSTYSNNDTGALLHFINFGMNEGRQANANFSLQSYRARYYDLRRTFGDNLKLYYLHYITNGKAEGRIATGSYLGGTAVLNGFDYSDVYNVNDYEVTNSDIQKAYGLNDIAALQHFVYYGMNEGRQASSTFNVFVYKNRYPDLQAAFGDNLKLYYLHYITNGKAEGRSGI